MPNLKSDVLSAPPADTHILVTGGPTGNIEMLPKALLSQENYTTTEKTKLAGIAAGATVNSSDANLKDRANHTGQQTAGTISDFQEAAQDAVAALLAAGTGVTLSYNDAGNSLTITGTTGGGGGGLDAEAVRDAIGVAMVGIGNITVTVNDAADTITISTTATANSTDAQLRDRSTHTGAQAISTVTGLQTALDANRAFGNLTGDPTDNPALVSYVETKLGSARFNVLDYGADPTFTADSTAAIQAAINACFDNGGGVVWFPNGHYKIAGAPSDWADQYIQVGGIDYLNETFSSGQLYIPLSKTYGNLPRISLQGESMTSPMAMILVTTPVSVPAFGGVLLESTITGVSNPNDAAQTQSILGTRAYSGQFGAENFVSVHMDNICLRAKAGSISGQTVTSGAVTVSHLDMGRIAQFQGGNILLDVNIPIVSTFEPTQQVYGFISPAYNNRGLSYVDFITILGTNFGCRISEHTLINYATIAGTAVAVELRDGGHRRSINKLQVEGSRYSFNLIGEGAYGGLYVTTYGAEHNQGAGHWYDFALDVLAGVGKEGPRIHFTHANVTLLPRLYTNNPDRVSVTFINGLPADGVKFDPLVNTNTNFQLDGLGCRGVSWLNAGSAGNYSVGMNKSISIVNAWAGAEFQILFQQNATGGFTLTLPANSVGTLPTIDPAPLAITRVKGWFDGTNFHWKAD